MSFNFTSNRTFKKGIIVQENQHMVLSIYSNKEINIGNKRWCLDFDKKKIYKTNNDLTVILKDSIPYKKPNITINCGTQKFRGKIRNIIYNTQSNLKNNNTRKFFLVFYINTNTNVKHKKITNINQFNINIKSKILKPPLFKYGFCDNFTYNPCTLKDYVYKKTFKKTLLSKSNNCIPFDTRKGPFNMYCAVNS
jgi:hypothetical protein